jgi:peptidyl-prolyl cis-trans isomerase D
MLDLLRSKAQSPFIQGTILIIVLVFVFWGVGSSYRGTLNSVATVNKEPITYEDFQKTYERVVEQYRTQFGGTLPKGLIESLGLDKQVLDQLIQRELLRQGAQKMGILVSDLEVRQAVEKMEAFRTDGIFNVEQYKSILSSSGMTPSSFEGSMRADLITSKVVDQLMRFAKVTPMEINENFNYENEEIKLAYVVFKTADFKEKIAVADEDLAAYYEENKTNYMTDPQVKLDFLAFPFNGEEKPAVTDEELNVYYSQNLNRYSSPEQRSARHILFKTSEEDSEDILSEKYQRAEEVLEMARSGEDFAELARQFSEGPTAPKGGDLGTFSRGRMVKPFEDAVFALSEDEISDVVETQFGFHIVKLEKIETARTKTLDEVKDSILATLQKQKSRELAFTNATESYEQIILAGSLGKFSENSEAKLIQTNFFQRKSPADSGQQEAIINEPAFLDAVFALNKGELSSLVETGKGYAIIFAADKKEPEVAPLEQVREQVLRDYIDEKAETIARESAETLLASLKEQHVQGSDDFGAEAAKLEDTVQESDFVNRSGFSRGAEKSQPLPPPVVTAGFSLTTDNPYPDDIVASNKDFYLFRLISKQSPPEDIFTEKEDDLKVDLLEEKKAVVLAAWIENEKSKAEIIINEQFQ